MPRDRITSATIDNVASRINELRYKNGKETLVVVERHQPGDSRTIHKIYLVDAKNEYRQSEISGLTSRMTARECYYTLRGILATMYDDI